MKIKIFLLIFLILSSCSKFEEKIPENIEKPSQTFTWEVTKEDLTNNNIWENIEILEDEKPTGLSEEKRKQIEILKKRFLVKNILKDWDMYYDSNQYFLALNKYNTALEQNPKDFELIKKIITINKKVFKFEDNLKIIEPVLDEIIDSEPEIVNDYILSLFYTKDISKKQDVLEITEIFKKLNITKDQKVYFTNSINCTLDIEICKIYYKNYIKENEKLSDNLLEIKQAFEKYTNFKTSQKYYQDTLLMSVFFQNELFSVSNWIWMNILKERPDYMPVIEMIWRWHYILWNYSKAKEYLVKLYNIDPNNKDIAFLLWEIFFKLKDYSTSNIYYNIAKKHSADQSPILRKMIYNHYILWDTQTMLNLFWELINQDNSTISDYSLALYHNILNKKLDKAIKYANHWIEKFNQVNWYEILYWYLWWIYREEWEYDLAKENLAKWLKINSSNHLILLNLWYLFEAQEKYKMALVYLKKCAILNENWEFWLLAQKEIEKIEKYLEVIDRINKIKQNNIKK